MSGLNHDAIRSILQAEVVGRFKVGHGQINSLADVQKYLELRNAAQPVPLAPNSAQPVLAEVIKAFHAVREVRQDQGSPELYIADPERNAAFLAQCRQLGLAESDSLLNKALLNARKNKHLPGLKSTRTRIAVEDCAFASEFAATELKYKAGANIDDILCDPLLAAQFDALATKLAPGYPALHYRWAILSLRKLGRKSAKRLDLTPELSGRFRLVRDTLDLLPETAGVYLLQEKDRPLYARATENLRHGVALHRQPQVMAAVANIFWAASADDFLVAYAVISNKDLLRPTEEKIVEEKKPLFNVPRAA